MSSINKNGNARIKHGPFQCSFKKAIKIKDVLDDTYNPIMDDETAMKMAENNEPLFRKIKNMRIDYNFENEFSEKFDNVRLWKLSQLYNKDIEKIKDHILWDQANDLLARMRKGYITIDEL
jgi:hypothetical protein